MPHTTGTNFFFRGRKVGRPTLVAEYIRRRTGEVRVSSQIDRRLAILRTKAGDDEDRELSFPLNTLSLLTRPSTVQALLKPELVDKEHLPRRDWDAHLGPDLYPSSAPPQPGKERKKSGSKSKSKSKKPKLTESLEPSKPPKPAKKPLPTSSTTQQALKNLPSFKRKSSTSTSKRTRSPSSSRSPPWRSKPSPAPNPSSPRAALPARPSVLSLQVTEAIEERLLPRHIEAFLLPFFPSRPEVAHSAASLLLRLGIDSLDALTELMLLGRGVLAVFLEQVAKVKDVEGHALDAARRAIEAARARYEGTG